MSDCYGMKSVTDIASLFWIEVEWWYSPLTALLRRAFSNTTTKKRDTCAGFSVWQLEMLLFSEILVVRYW